VALRELLFPAGDPHACAHVLDALAADEGLRRSLGGRLRKRQRQSFTLDVHVDALCDLYDRVVGLAGTGRGDFRWR
jgi:glycosyltransferase involved in cell wall biosynthesis